MSEMKLACGIKVTTEEWGFVTPFCGQSCPDESGQFAACMGGESGPNGPGTCRFCGRDEEFQRGKQHGRWTFLWNEDRGYFRMRRHAKRARKAKNKAVK